MNEPNTILMQTFIAITDLGSIGTALAMIVIAALQYYHLHRSKRRDVVVEEIKQSVTEVHKLTNGNMGEQLKISMVSAQTLANQTGQPEHIKLAESATARYRVHLESEKALKEKPQ